MVEEEETSFSIPTQQNDDFNSYLIKSNENRPQPRPHYPPLKHLKVNSIYFLLHINGKLSFHL